MTSSAGLATVKFLQSAAYDLIQTSPAISAHLYERFLETAEVFDFSLPTQQLSRLACLACNTVWIPGCNVHVCLHDYGPRDRPSKVVKKRKDKRQRLAALDLKSPKFILKDEILVNRFTGKTVCYVCLVCEHVTRFRLSPVNKIPAYPLVPAELTPMAIPVSTPLRTNAEPKLQTPKAVTPTSTPVSSNASSKKRQKMRKQNSLQQMLVKAKAEKQGRTMNLMDMMKSAKNG
ncbi:hypothetical protein V1512DRAFT_167599 [Lipomyces arxii]|uniref:uncharacterized protein n=1 Tax=Lipomyces arxii TaxID=56418 RepID=UPI0034CFF1C3